MIFLAGLFVLLLVGAPLIEAAQPESPESLRGRVVQIISEGAGGVLLDCRPENYLNNNDQTAGLELKDFQGSAFLFGHPHQKKFVDDQLVGVVAVRAGTYRYQTALGAEKTVAAYKFLKIATSSLNP